MKRKQLSTAIHGVLALSLLAAVPAMAQDAPQASAQEGETAKTLDTVTVTARRRVESIQDVPVAVTAFGENELKDLQASNIDGLQGAVPNMNIVQGRGSSNSINVFIDGVGQKNYVTPGGLTGMDDSPGNPFPQSAIGEFKVITSNYKAEYDQLSSAAVTAVTRSGTNDFEGSVFWDKTTESWREPSPALSS